MDGSEQQNNSNGSWQFKPEGSVVAMEPELVSPTSVASPPTGPDGAITWSASEFIAHQKNPGWYGLLAAAAVVAAFLVWLFTRDVISAIFILIAAGIFGVFASRQPRELTYRIDDHGLTIGPKHFDYRDFRSFAVVREGAFSSIVFVPLKRFAPLTTIYYDPRDEEKIVDVLSDRLPIEDRRSDPVDRLMWRIRF